MPFNVQGAVAASDVLKEITRISGFDIIIKSLPKSQTKVETSKKKDTKGKKSDIRTEQETLQELFTNTHIAFKGNSISKFLDTFSQTFKCLRRC